VALAPPALSGRALGAVASLRASPTEKTKHEQGCGSHCDLLIGQKAAARYGDEYCRLQRGRGANKLINVARPSGFEVLLLTGSAAVRPVVLAPLALRAPGTLNAGRAASMTSRRARRRSDGCVLPERYCVHDGTP
jgi:hypothetical protein